MCGSGWTMDSADLRRSATLTHKPIRPSLLPPPLGRLQRLPPRTRANVLHPRSRKHLPCFRCGDLLDSPLFWPFFGRLPRCTLTRRTWSTRSLRCCLPATSTLWTRPSPLHSSSCQRRLSGPRWPNARWASRLLPSSASRLPKCPLCLAWNLDPRSGLTACAGGFALPAPRSWLTQSPSPPQPLPFRAQGSRF